MQLTSELVFTDGLLVCGSGDTPNLETRLTGFLMDKSTTNRVAYSLLHVATVVIYITLIIEVNRLKTDVLLSSTAVL